MRYVEVSELEIGMTVVQTRKIGMRNVGTTEATITAVGEVTKSTVTGGREYKHFTADMVANGIPNSGWKFMLPLYSNARIK